MYLKIIFSNFLLLIIFNVTQSQELSPQSFLNPSDQIAEQYISYESYVAEVDDYWQNTPHDFKGSGIKPYLRWKENSKYLLKPNATLLTPDEIQSSWEAVQNWQNTIDPLDDNSNWIPLGPFNHINGGSWSSGQGRVNVCTIDPNDPDTVYIGTPDGGAWKSTDHGDSWESITDDLPVWGVSGIAIDYNNSNIIYVATGDEDGWNSYANGVWKSTDGGQTWNEAGNINANQLGEIYIHPTNSNILWVCSSEGLYRSANAGNNWALVESEGEAREIRLKPNDPNTLYIVMEHFQLNIKKSTDGGITFNTIKSYSDPGRTVIEVTPANPDVLYVLNSNSDGSFNQLDKSTNAGQSFTTQNSTTDIYESYQAYYDLALVVSDTDENKLYTGCLNIWESNNGGQNFTPYNAWYDTTDPKYTHADIHDLKTYNGNLYACTDGGIYISEDNGVSFQDKTINGLNIGQFYRMDVAQNNLNQMVGGLQDNGGYAHSNNQWYNYHGADGMDCAIDPTNPNFYYGFIQFGSNLYRYSAQNQTGTYVNSSPNDIMGNWVTPLEFGNGGTLYAGYNQLYKRVGNSLVLASSHTFNSNLSEIKVAPDNDNLLLVSDSNGQLFQSDGTQNINFGSSISPNGDQVLTFDFNKNNSSILYATTYFGVYKSINGGLSWIDITYNLPDQTYFIGIEHQQNSVNNTVYLAARNAVYYTNDDMSSWQLFSSGLPHSQIMDIKVNNAENHVLIATYGRGVWRSPVDGESLEVEDIAESSSPVYIYPNPAQDFVKLSVTIEETVEAQILSLDGKLIQTQNFEAITTDTQIDVSGLAQGIYIIQLTSPTHLITKKIIKE